VEVNSETDFVAKTDNFKNFVAAVAEKALEGVDPAEAMKDELVAIVSATGENVKIRRSALFQKEGTGKIESYIHMGGKVGVLVEVGCGKEETAASEAFAALVHDVALQVAAAAPRWLDRGQVDPAVLESEMNLYRQQLAGQDKPAAIMDNILKGKANKFYSDVCLVDQLFVKNEPGEKTTVGQLVKKAAKDLDDTIAIRRFVRFQLGAA
jgi:elongation factor Ts